MTPAGIRLVMVGVLLTLWFLVGFIVVVLVMSA